MARRLLAALLAGGASVFAFAPFDLFPLAFLGLGVLAWVLGRAVRVRDAFALGFAWGLGAFLGGVSWLYVALERYGGMPAPLAALAIALFCAYLALYPGLVGAAFVSLQRRIGARSAAGGAGGGAEGAGLPAKAASRRAMFAGKPAPTGPASPAMPIRSAALFAALWLLSEWLRGVVFTGFPWLAIGYSQTPPSPLGGLLAVIGVYGVGGVVAFVAALLAFTPRADWLRPRRAWRPALAVAVLFAGGAGLLGRAWTGPTGQPLQVALVQTNFEQGLKWDPERFAEVLQVNRDLVLEAFSAPKPPTLVVLPETTLPTLLERLPEGYLDWLAWLAGGVRGDLVMGVFRRDEAGHIYNAAVSLGSAPAQHYAKQHLVPFGEYSPPLFGWFYKLAQIPMSDQTRGAPEQPPMRFGDQQVALNICYEDLFGAELIRVLPAATLLLNISNLAWYGDSLAQPQHLQIARVRALETGRPMLRSTNTGMTALVQPDGSVTGVLAEFERGVLRVEAQGYSGLTPYARWGDWLALGLALLILMAVFLRRVRGSGLARESGT
ncbi:apolipoprotein N-acyltransferase [Thauera sp.]|jgi:apolipoprotein N-acyltransferase|uniref:apolipoprotein N-acyltransferase n=1 Tax=Thauera sp. TaxID=1905334 RepID=UPI002A36E7F0|nr:apolipoprotein N-acyltransferase [Thauera sp.]MDX9885850.1 apolipoprotein N-acyltransferase [Thauera sp.]